MNIACTACSARYGVADEKLIGKRVRITCKRCGTVLIVDGHTDPPTVSASTSMAPSPPASNRPASEARAPAPVAEPPFMVAFADGRQEQADIAQIVRFHRAGQLGTDSLVWRDGMGDWADPWDVAEISAAFRRMGYARPTPAPAPLPTAPVLQDAVDDEATQVVESSPHHQAPLFDDNEATHVVDSSRLASPEPLRDPRVASRPVTDDDDSPTHVGRERGAATHAATGARDAQRARRTSARPAAREAARNEPQRAPRQAEPQRARAERRSRSARPVEGPPAEDLFARQRLAGSEEEQAQAQANLGPGYELDIPKLTGARNESSVLFSLDSLLKQEQKSLRPARPPRRDESLLVDSGSSMPIGGGIAPALAAPDFTAPISSPPPQFAPARAIADEERVRSSRGWPYVVVLVAFGGAGALGWTTGALRPLLVKAGVMAPPPATASAEGAQPVPSGARDGAVSNAQPDASAVASAAASPDTAPSASAAPEKPIDTAVAAAPRAPATGTAVAAAVAAPKPAAASAPHETATKEKEASHEAATTAAAPAAGGAPFDTGAAKEVLTAAASNVASCKEMGGPVGSGKVAITFAVSGRPTSVAVTGALVGTTVGSWVARLFRSVKVPPFAGDPVTVAKSFSLE